MGCSLDEEEAAGGGRARIAPPLADMPPLAEVPLPAFCSWLIGELLRRCGSACACSVSFATALSENIAAATATAMGVMFMVSFPDCLEENYPLIGASGMPGQAAGRSGSDIDGDAVPATPYLAATSAGARARHRACSSPRSARAAAVPPAVLPSASIVLPSCGCRLRCAGLLLVHAGGSSSVSSSSWPLAGMPSGQRMRHRGAALVPPPADRLASTPSSRNRHAPSSWRRRDTARESWNCASAACVLVLEVAVDRWHRSRAHGACPAPR